MATKIRDIILDFSKQFAAGFEAAGEIGKSFKGELANVFICGMGGSALPGELMKTLETEIPFLIHKDYGLPRFINEKSLLCFISYSGNTEETLSALKAALEKKLKIVCITSGGQMEDICKKNNLPLARVPQGIPPRMALGYQFSALLKIAENAGIIQDTQKKVSQTINSLEIDQLEQKGKELSEIIYGKIPLLYGPRKYFPLIYVFKILLNENDKIPAFCDYFPELCHNEIQAFKTADDRFATLILEDEDETENDGMKKTIKSASEIMEEHGFKVHRTSLRKAGQNIFDTIINGLMLFYWTTYYIAGKKGIDPLENSLIDEFKKKLER